MSNTTRLSDLELAVTVFPQATINLHRVRDVESLQTIANDLIADLASSPADRTRQNKLLIVLALIDHLEDGRTAGMIPDYLNW